MLEKSSASSLLRARNIVYIKYVLLTLINFVKMMHSNAREFMSAFGVMVQGNCCSTF